MKDVYVIIEETSYDRLQKKVNEYLYNWERASQRFYFVGGVAVVMGPIGENKFYQALTTIKHE